MALSDLSFKLYSDSGLTTLYSGLTQLVHQSDLSDNPNDFTLYFGSTQTSRVLEATSNPGVDQITLTPTEQLQAWAASTAYSVGDSRRPTTENGFRYRVKSIAGGGTSGASEPTFPTSGIGSTVVDNEVTWELVAAAHQDTEIKLALTSGGLAGATAGAALNLGTSIDSGVANAVEIHVRVTNAVTTVSNNTDDPELAVNINSVTERAA